MPWTIVKVRSVKNTLVFSLDRPAVDAVNPGPPPKQLQRELPAPAGRLYAEKIANSFPQATPLFVNK